MRIWDQNANMMVPYYLMLSYLYYEKDITLIPDTEFDALCKKLLEKFDEVKHQHKHLIDKSDLKAGTGYSLKYTNLIKGAAMALSQKGL